MDKPTLWQLISQLRLPAPDCSADVTARTRTNSRMLVVAAVCAVVSVASASYTRGIDREKEPILTVPDARQVLRSDGDWHRRRQALESLRVRAIEAIDRLELARGDIVLREQAECALESIRQELGR